MEKSGQYMDFCTKNRGWNSLFAHFSLKIAHVRAVLSPVRPPLQLPGAAAESSHVERMGAAHATRATAPRNEHLGAFRWRFDVVWPFSFFFFVCVCFRYVLSVLKPVLRNQATLQKAHIILSLPPGCSSEPLEEPFVTLDVLISTKEHANRRETSLK